MNELISKKTVLDAIDEISREVDDGDGFDYAKWREYFCELPSAKLATDTNVGTKLVIDPHKIERAIRGLTEWQKHVQTESDIDRDISVAVEALKAQLGMNLAELGTDCISRQAAIDAIEAEKIKHGNYLTSSYVGYEMAEKVVKQLLPIQPKRGRWVLVCDNNGMHFICNKCGAWRYHQKQKFCEECGADMRGEQDE